jgi:hypothetical protein
MDCFEGNWDGIVIRPAPSPRVVAASPTGTCASIRAGTRSSTAWGRRVAVRRWSIAAATLSHGHDRGGLLGQLSHHRWSDPHSEYERHSRRGHRRAGQGRAVLARHERGTYTVPARPQPAGWRCAAPAGELPWLAYNAMIHSLAPRGWNNIPAVAHDPCHHQLLQVMDLWTPNWPPGLTPHLVRQPQSLSTSSKCCLTGSGHLPTLGPKHLRPGNAAAKAFKGESYAAHRGE